MKNTFIKPEWPASSHINAYSTTRLGGVSAFPYESFNLGLGTEDKKEDVLSNRERLKIALQLPEEPCWIKQTHSNVVIDAIKPGESADASYTHQSHRVCIVQTADCLPILICNSAGTEVAAVHAGWRGLAANIITNTINRFRSGSNELLVWLGPCIGPQKFEVGAEVREVFVNINPQNSEAFIPHHNTKYLGNLHQLARQELASLGIENIYACNHCTYSEPDLFFSYRRDGSQSGRMATLIWME